MSKKFILSLCFLFFTAPAAFAADKVNTNTATQEQLMNLNEIGEFTAMAIIKYRDSVGSFKEILELTQVKDIGEKS